MKNILKLFPLLLALAISVFGQASITGTSSTLGTSTLLSTGSGGSLTQVQKVLFNSTGDSTTQTATISAAVASNTLLAVVASDATITITGWTADVSNVSGQGEYIFRKTAVGGETSVAMNLSGSTSAVAVIFEYSGLTASPFDKSATNLPAGSVATCATGTTATLSQATELSIGGVCWNYTTNPTTVTGWSNSYVSQGAVTSTGSATNIRLEVAILTTSATTAQSSTATFGVNTTTPQGIIGTYKP